MIPKVNAIANGFAILKYLSIQKSPLGVTKIAKATGISPSSCFNILKTLVELNLATFDVQTKGYGMGFAVIELAQNTIANNLFIKTAKPHVQELAERYNGFAGLWEVSKKNPAVLIATAEQTARVRLNIDVGYTQAVGRGSVGRAVLSQFLDDTAFIESAFKEVKWEGDITLSEYIKDIHQAAKRGYAVDRNKLFLGGTSISVLLPEPIAGQQYCISFFGISSRYKRNEIEQIGRYSLSVAKKLLGNAHNSELVPAGLSA